MLNSNEPKKTIEHSKTSTIKSFNKIQAEFKNIESTLSSRKSANSWLAQSFRKAFGKIDNRRKLNKSQNQLNNQTGKTNSSTLSINAVDANHSSNSKRSSLSDDESENLNPKSRQNKNKLSLIPSSNDGLNDTDSDCDDEDAFKQSEFLAKHKNSSLVMTKRSYRSESELAYKSSNKHANSDSSTVKNENSINTNNSNINTKGSNLNIEVSSKTSNCKLIKTHKSVSSLLTTSTITAEHQFTRLNELNQQLNQSNCQSSNTCNNQSQQSKLFFNKTSTQNSPNNNLKYSKWLVFF